MVTRFLRHYTRYVVLGQVPENAETVHVVYRRELPPESIANEFDRIGLITVRRTEVGWRVKPLELLGNAFTFG
jgi:hypothetical protein